ncbi:serine protease [Nostoc sp. NMS8]|uniref:serine protease n=1 Tax=Nostoc sp. NMS8 TaxID=2815392 RepID=UPI0025CF25AC|nr:serine protease [Nostoc sp. NMS8]MBN3959647.1 tetratricopeptide repeat protein [Nostoc sp. NMS8]
MKLHKLSSLLLFLVLLFAAAPIVVTGCSYSLFVPKARTLSEQELENTLKEITVKVIADNQEAASGTIIKKQNGFYTVLTNYHVVKNAKFVKIVTSDNQVYNAEAVKLDRQDNQKDDLYDLAKVTFSSENIYQVAGLAEDTIKLGDRVFAGGYVKGNFQTTKGQVRLFLNQALIKGHQIAYDNDIQQGMSGGAIINEAGNLVGINSKIAHPILQNDFRYLKGEQPDENILKEWGNYSWGIAINLVDEAAPDLALFPEREIIKNGGIPAKVLAIAKQSSVRIEGKSGIGSGVIIAKDNDVYYVLTAAHVVEREQDYQVVAPDKQVYRVNNKTIRTRKGLDMAVFQFRSFQEYQVAKLADYELKEQYVFLYGWKGEEINHPSLFNAGAMFSTLDLGRFSIRKFFQRGYELVYTNEGYPGMSGGGIWDTKGQLIGIHNASESDFLGYSLGLSVQSYLFYQREALWNLPEAKLNLSKNEPDTEDVNSIQISIPSPPDVNGTGNDWLKYGVKLWRIQEDDKAIDAMEKAINLDPNLWQVYYNIAVIWLSRGQYELSLSAINMAINKQSTLEIHRSYLLKSLILEHFKKTKSAIEYISLGIKAAEELQKKEPLLYLMRADLLKKSKQYNAAIIDCNKAIEINPQISESYLLRADIYEEQKLTNLAITDYSQAININPKSTVAYYNRGVIYDKQGKNDLAIADYSQAININPKLTDAYKNRAIIYEKQGKNDLAIADYTQAININTKFTDAYNNRAIIYEKQGKNDLAIADYTQAININPQDERFYYNRGIVYSEQGKQDFAIFDYTQAINLNPQFVNAISQRGLEYLNQGKLYPGIADYKKVVMINSQYATTVKSKFISILILGAIGNSGLGNTDLAIKNYTKVIEIDPQYADAYKNRGVLYAKQGNIQQVIKDLETAKQLYQQQGNIDKYQQLKEILNQL